MLQGQLNFATNAAGFSYKGAPVFLLQEALGPMRQIWVYLNTPFRIGNFEVSVSGFVTAIIIIIVAIALSRSFTSLLDRRIATRAQIDPGIRYTIARLASYIVVSIGVLLALKQAFNLDLTSIAVLFTALSVGIGFGLQYIAADIASGFILLFERPIRVGDRITIDEDDGDVQSINFRNTIVVTNDRVSIIVPNSRLVSQRVINWSYGDPRARIPVPIGVAYGSDVKLVTDTLMEAAEGVSNVLKDPPPRVQFLGFGDFSLDFRLLVWSNQPRRHVQIKSDINYRIEELFRERNIQIPFPVRDLRLQDGQTSGDLKLIPAEKGSDRSSNQSED
jgi:potassium efflux system protein